MQAQYRFGSDTILRAAYGMGIARPNFGDIAPFFIDDPTSNPEFSKGNPALKPTHAQNFDVLVERYLKPLGIIQAGFFYHSGGLFLQGINRSNLWSNAQPKLAQRHQHFSQRPQRAHHGF